MDTLFEIKFGYSFLKSCLKSISRNPVSNNLLYLLQQLYIKIKAQGKNQLRKKRYCIKDSQLPLHCIVKHFRPIFSKCEKYMTLFQIFSDIFLICVSVFFSLPHIDLFTLLCLMLGTVSKLSLNASDHC